MLHLSKLLASHPEIEPNTSSCAEILHFKEACYTAKVLMDLILVFGILGLIGNAHILWFFGVEKRLKAPAHKLFFLFGLLDFVSCGLTATNSVLYYYPPSISGCVFNSVIHILRTRVAFYVFGFLVCARFYVTCLKRDEKSFLDFTSTRIVAVLLTMFSAFDLAMYIEVECYKYGDDKDVLYSKQNRDAVEGSWELATATFLQFFNWFSLIIVTILVLFFYYLIWKCEKQNKDFQFTISEYNRLTESVVTRIFRAASIVGLICYYPQWCAHILGYVIEINSLKVFWATTLSTYFGDLFNFFMFESTPIIFYYIDDDFRFAIKKLWRDVITKVCCLRKEYKVIINP